MMTADQIKTLKAQVKAEMLRRKYTGSVASYGGAAFDFTVQPTKDGPILAEHGNKVIQPINAVKPVAGLPNAVQGQPIPAAFDYAGLTKIVNDMAAIPATAANGGCSGSCTGLCQGGCATGCSSCTGSCSGGCTGTCDGSCDGCSGSCDGTCTGCGSGCSGTCTGCGSGCSSGCEGTCTGSGCGFGCGGGNCTATCVGSCYDTCSGTSTGKSAESIEVESDV